jgi:hypothetical protein
LAPNVTVSFWRSNDINNATPLYSITDEDEYFKGLKIVPDLYGLGGWELTLARTGFELFDVDAVLPETFVRILIHAYSDTDWYYGGTLNKRALDVVQRDELGAEQFIIGGSGPKQYLDRYRLGIEQLTGTGWNLDLANGVWRWNESASAIRILTRIINEDAAADDPALPDLTRSFSSTADSNGDPMDDVAGEGTFELPIGNSLLQSIWDLEDLDDLYTTISLGTVADPTYTLDAWGSYGEVVGGTSFGTGVCRLVEGVNIANESLTVEGVAIKKATHVIIEGKDGNYQTAIKPGWSSGDYVKWAKIEYNRSNSLPILEKAGIRWLKRQDNGDQQLTVEIVPGADEASGYYFPGPGEVLWLGNTISVDTKTDGDTHAPLDYNNAAHLVTGFEIELGPAGDETTADTAAKSWDVKVKLNHERAGHGGSPNQGSASGNPGNGGGEGCKCLKLCKVHVEGDPPSEVVTPLFNFNANSDGGDTLDWTGILANQSGGAAGTSHYYFKSNSPEHYADALAVSAGVDLRVSGYVKDMSAGEEFLLAFFTSGQTIGDPGGGTFLIGSPTVLHAAPASAWTFFTVDVTTPPTTASMALTRTGAISFDQVEIASVVSDPGTGGQDGDIPEDVGEEGGSGTGDSAARCDHVHAHGFLSEDEAHHHDADQIEGGVTLDYGEDADIADLAFDDVADAGVLDEVARADHVHGMPTDPGSGGGHGAWTDYTPTVIAATTNPVIASRQGRYKELDSKTYAIQVRISYATGDTAGSGSWSISLPSGLTSGNRDQMISGQIHDAGTRRFIAQGFIAPSTTNITNILHTESGNNGTVNQSNPMTWANGDQIILSGVIEVA